VLTLTPTLSLILTLTLTLLTLNCKPASPQARAFTLLTDERQNVGRGRHVLGDEHQKHGHRQQRRDAHRHLVARSPVLTCRHGNGDVTHRHLFAGVARDVEAEQRDERDDEARHDHVEDVEERLAAHLHRVRDVRRIDDTPVSHL